MKAFTSAMALLVTLWSLAAPLTVRAATPRTRVSIVDGRWHLNGEVTYRGARAEGLLLNVRMVNSTFEDRLRPEFDAEANSDEFIAQIPDYVAHGVLAFTLNLQGGMPGYEGAVNSAFNADGSLRDPYMARVRRVIEVCDRHGAAVILGCYYQRQDQLLKDENAVRTGVVNAVKWIQAAGFSNVVLEIANEFGHDGFNHRILQSPGGQVELMQLARRSAPDLLVSTSGLGDGESHESVARASDFLLVHFNSTRLEEIPRRIAALKRYGKPILCNEDQKLGERGVRAAELCVANGASWGLMIEKVNQHFPFTFQGAADDPVVYAALKQWASVKPVSNGFAGEPVIPPALPGKATSRLKMESGERKLIVRAQLPGQDDWVELATYVMETNSRPYLHPVRDALGRVVLTEDRPADHVWQHGIFTGFHRVNGFNYWKEDEGRQRFVRLLDTQEASDYVTWRALVELFSPNGSVVLEEEDRITIHAPESPDAYIIDFDFLLRAKEENVTFGKFFVGGLAVRMPWDKANPCQTHLNSSGLRGRECEQQRAAWCNVERPFGNDIFGIAVFDHPGNPNHPAGWRADEQGLINPNVSALGDWSLTPKETQRFRYRLLVYRGSATHEQLTARFESFRGDSRHDTEARP